MQQKYYPVTEKQKDGYARLMKFPDDTHWAYWNRERKCWYYRPYFDDYWTAHSADPTEFKPLLHIDYFEFKTQQPDGSLKYELVWIKDV